MPERTHAAATPRAREETRSKGVTRLPFSSRFKERSRSADSKSNSVRAHPKAALRPAVASAVAEKLRHRRSPSPKQKTAAGLPVGQHRRPGIGRAPVGARTPTDQSPIIQPEMPERTHAAATPRAREETRSKGVTRLPFSSRFKERSRSADSKSNSVRAHPKAALRPAVASAVAEKLRHRRSPSPKQKTAAGLPVGQHRRPGIGRAPVGARTPTDQSPIIQPEMPERTHAAATPRAREETRSKGVTRLPFSSRFKERSRSADSKSNSVRAHPKAALRPAVASAVAEKLRHRRSPSPKQKTAAGLPVGQHRRPGIGRAPVGARTPTDQSPIIQPEMPERTHAAATPRAREETRSKGVTRLPFSSRFKERSRSADSKSNSVRAHPKAALRPAVASAVAEKLRHRRSPSPKQKTAAGLPVGQHRRPGIGRAPVGARTPTDQSPIIQPEMPERTHAAATPRAREETRSKGVTRLPF